MSASARSFALALLALAASAACSDSSSPGTTPSVVGTYSAGPVDLATSFAGTCTVPAFQFTVDSTALGLGVATAQDSLFLPCSGYPSGQGENVFPAGASQVGDTLQLSFDQAPYAVSNHFTLAVRWSRSVSGFAGLLVLGVNDSAEVVQAPFVGSRQ